MSSKAGSSPTVSPDATARWLTQRAQPELDFLDAGFVQNPYPTYADLLTRAPVHRTSQGFWCVLRHQDCATALRDSARWSADSRNAFNATCFEEPSEAFGGTARVFPYLFWDPPRLGKHRPFLFLDDPDHRRVRSLVSQAFRRSAVQNLGPRIEELADELLGRAFVDSSFDLVSEFAYPLPITIICELLGVPVKDHAVFRGLSKSLRLTIAPQYLLSKEEREAGRSALIALVRYLARLMEGRRTSPGPDLVSSLLIAEERSASLSAPEVIATVMILLLAGHETTVNLIANGTLALLRERSQAAVLASEPAFAGRAVEEVLRFDPPVQLVARTALADVDVGTQLVRRGEHALFVIASANHDPEVFAHPHRFDMTRADASRHLAFGWGVHACVGSWLARLEGEIALRAIAARLEDLILVRNPSYTRDALLRGPVSLVLRRRRSRSRWGNQADKRRPAPELADTIPAGVSAA